MAPSNRTTIIWKAPPDLQESSVFFSRFVPEIRGSIFSYIVGTSLGRASAWNPQGSNAYDRLYLGGEPELDDVWYNPQCTNFLLVCKKWHDEMAPLMYRSVHLKLHMNSRAEIQLFDLLPYYLQCVRSLVIEFETVAHAQENREPCIRSGAAERVADTLRLCKQAGMGLQTVTFICPWQRSENGGPVDIMPLFADPTLFSTLKWVAFVKEVSRFPTMMFSFSYYWDRPLPPEAKDAIGKALGFEPSNSHPKTLDFMLLNRNWATNDTNLACQAHTPEFRSLVLQQDQKLENSGVGVSRPRKIVIDDYIVYESF